MLKINVLFCHACLQCVPPFVGDGVLCTVDSDGDSYPDQPLESDTCLGNASTQYCEEVCVIISNMAF